MSSPLDTVERFLGAANAGDVGAAVACLSPGFECLGPDGFRLDREGMAVWLGWEAEFGYAYRLNDVAVSPERVTALMREDSELYRLLGMPTQSVRLVFEVVGETIERQRFEPLPSGPSLAEALTPFFAWLGAGGRALPAGCVADGLPVFSRESARCWRPLLRAWREGG